MTTAMRMVNEEEGEEEEQVVMTSKNEYCMKKRGRRGRGRRKGTCTK